MAAALDIRCDVDTVVSFASDVRRAASGGARDYKCNFFRDLARVRSDKLVT
jgi:hypothetical protein